MQDKRDIENVVQEIMGLVDDFGLKAEAYSHQEVTAVELISARRLVESKLRELVENSFSVRKLSMREPLSDDVIKMIDDGTHFHESTDWPIRFARNIERAHRINTEKDDE